GRTRVTLVCECEALRREANRLMKPVVSCVGLGHQLGELRGGTGQITLPALCDSEAPTALERVEPVTDRLGEIASFLTGGAHRDQITRHKRRERLPAEDLAEPPRVAQCAGQAERLSQVTPGRLCVEEAGDVAASG